MNPGSMQRLVRSGYRARLCLLSPICSRHKTQLQATQDQQIHPRQQLPSVLITFPEFTLMLHFWPHSICLSFSYLKNNLFIKEKIQIRQTETHTIIIQEYRGRVQFSSSILQEMDILYLNIFQKHPIPVISTATNLSQALT